MRLRVSFVCNSTHSWDFMLVWLQLCMLVRLRITSQCLLQLAYPHLQYYLNICIVGSRICSWWCSPELTMTLFNVWKQWISWEIWNIVLVTIMVIVIWNVTPCSVAEIYWHFFKKNLTSSVFTFQEWGQCVPRRLGDISTKLHCVTSRKTALFNTTIIFLYVNLTISCFYRFYLYVFKYFCFYAL